MIEVERLTKHYGDRAAVQDVSFEVGEGDIVGFLGPNGAGKSTTLRMITGFLAPTEGRIRVGGVDALAHPIEARRLIGYMPEGVPLYPELRVHEYLRHRAELKGVPRKGMATAVERSLEQAGVTDARDRIIGQLSKGYRQRVGLADALVADPPFLILDEPTSGLDPNQIRQVRSLIKSFAGKKVVLVSTHILPEVEATCGRVIIIHRGRIAGQGTPDTLRSTEGAVQTVSFVGRGGEPEFRRALEDVPALRKVQEVLPLEGNEGVLRVRVQTDAGPEAAEAVFRAVAEAGMALRELKVDAASLEDVFTHLTTQEELARDEAEEEDDADDGEGPSEDIERPDAGAPAHEQKRAAATATESEET
ncbi:MAG: ABC transporter ATP-binding protein [Myxococcota bacterium]